MDKFFAVMAVCFNLWVLLLTYLCYGKCKRNNSLAHVEEAEMDETEEDYDELRKTQVIKIKEQVIAEVKRRSVSMKHRMTVH